MFSSVVTTLALLAAVSVNASPTPFDKRDPQFGLNLGQLLSSVAPFSGMTRGNTTNGGRPFGFLGGFRGGAFGNGGMRNATTRPFPFNFLPFKRDGEMEELAYLNDFLSDLPFTGDESLSLPFDKRDPQFGLHFGQLLTSPLDLLRGNTTTGGGPLGFLGGFRGGAFGNGGTRNTTTRPFPFNFLPFKRDEETEKREPQALLDSLDVLDVLPVIGGLTGDLTGSFGNILGQGANGNGLGNFGNAVNASTGTQAFPFNFLNFKRED